MKTAVITTGGLGTRLMTFSKVNPKTMLPLYTTSIDNDPDPYLRPLIEIIFENLYNFGFRKFCFIVGTKTKKSILQHFNVDNFFIELLKKRSTHHDKRFIKVLMQLYKKINDCEITWIPQNAPLGFGHALLSAKKFVKNDPFLLHTGDAYFPKYDFLPKFIEMQKKKDATAILLLQYKKIMKDYGVAELRKLNGNNVVLNVEEKPKNPTSNMAILPIYIFKPKIFDALKKTKLGHNHELQVTDAIKTLLNWNEKILSFNFCKNTWFDIGITHNYFKAICYSYKHSLVNY